MGLPKSGSPDRSRSFRFVARDGGTAASPGERQREQLCFQLLPGRFFVRVGTPGASLGGLGEGWRQARASGSAFGTHDHDAGHFRVVFRLSEGSAAFARSPRSPPPRACVRPVVPAEPLLIERHCAAARSAFYDGASNCIGSVSFSFAKLISLAAPSSPGRAKPLRARTSVWTPGLGTSLDQESRASCRSGAS